MKEYMIKYGYDYEDLAIWPIKMHERGSKNPLAYMKKQATLKDVLESEVVADPLSFMTSHLPWMDQPQ